MLGLWGTGNGPMGLRLHFAFQVTLVPIAASVAALREAGLRPRSEDGNAIDEPEVIPWIAAASVYFDDPDGHSLECIAMLPDAPQPNAPRVPLSQWKLARAGPRRLSRLRARLAACRARPRG
jgi:lactoylglutathione lyase